MSYPCVLCDQQIRPRQHTLQCEGCDKSQHRLCNTGISITDYRLMVDEEVDIMFHCAECVRIPQDMEVEAPAVLEAPLSPTPASPLVFVLMSRKRKRDYKAARWHRRFNGKAAHNHLHFYKIVPAFQKEAKTVSITQQLVSEQQLSRYQRDTYKQLQGRLTPLWDQYEEDSIRTSDFLRSVGHLYAPPVPQPETLPESDSEDSD